MSLKFHTETQSNRIVRSLDQGKLKKDWSGAVIGWITVIKPLGFNRESGAVYLCKDIFGEEFSLSARTFTRKNSKYAVWLKESAVKLKHLGKCYFSMLDRCLNPNNASSKYYYCKGIKIAEEWLGERGRINFIEWAVKNGYQKGLSLDRTGEHYTPETCRWVTRRDNSRYKSTTILNAESVRYIRELYASQEDSKSAFARRIAPEYGVKADTICNVVSNRRWN